ncbi:MAG: hypothetical protein AAGI17_02895 [Planctomycetota bacterium]
MVIRPRAIGARTTTITLLTAAICGPALAQPAAHPQREAWASEVYQDGLAI